MEVAIEFQDLSLYLFFFVPVNSTVFQCEAEMISINHYFSFQDVVYALAHATGKTGRFTLIERWRNNERLLAPQEHPLKVS